MCFNKLIRNLLVCGYIIGSAVFLGCGEDKETVNSLRIDPSETEIPGAGGERTITVISNVEWKLENTTSWITVKDQTSGAFTIEAGENNEEERSGEITITASGATNQTLTVTQKVKKGTIIVYPESLEFTRRESRMTLTVTDTNVDWDVDCQATWVELSTQDNVVTVKVADLNDFDDRHTEIIFTGKNAETRIPVTQLYGGFSIRWFADFYAATSYNCVNNSANNWTSQWHKFDAGDGLTVLNFGQNYDVDGVHFYIDLIDGKIVPDTNWSIMGGTYTDNQGVKHDVDARLTLWAVNDEGNGNPLPGSTLEIDPDMDNRIIDLSGINEERTVSTGENWYHAWAMNAYDKSGTILPNVLFVSGKILKDLKFTPIETRTGSYNPVPFRSGKTIPNSSSQSVKSVPYNGPVLNLNEVEFVVID